MTPGYWLYEAIVAHSNVEYEANGLNKWNGSVGAYHPPPYQNTYFADMVYDILYIIQVIPIIQGNYFELFNI